MNLPSVPDVPNLPTHVMRYGIGEDKSKADESAARDPKQKFLSDFKNPLVANLGEQGAQDAMLTIQTTASQLSGETIRKYVNDLSTLVNGAIRTSESDASKDNLNQQSSVHESENSKEERQRQCMLGNQAAYED